MLGKQIRLPQSKSYLGIAISFWKNNDWKALSSQLTIRKENRRLERAQQLRALAENQGGFPISTR